MVCVCVCVGPSVFLRDMLEFKCSRLVDELYYRQVVSAEERDSITAEKTSFRANEKLLNVFQLFLDALDNCGQQHVCNEITDQRPGSSVHLIFANAHILAIT